MPLYKKAVLASRVSLLLRVICLDKKQIRMELKNCSKKDGVEGNVFALSNTNIYILRHLVNFQSADYASVDSNEAQIQQCRKQKQGIEDGRVKRGGGDDMEK